MVQVILAKEVSLAQLSETFGLERTDDQQFFREWQDDLLELSGQEKQALDGVRSDYLHLSKYPLLEPIVKMVVLSPLLKLEGEPRYARSYPFSLYRGDDLYEVVSGLKHLAQLVNQ